MKLLPALTPWARGEMPFVPQSGARSGRTSAPVSSQCAACSRLRMAVNTLDSLAVRLLSGHSLPCMLADNKDYHEI